MAQSNYLTSLYGEPPSSQKILTQLKNYPKSYELFSTLSPNNQTEFLDFCSGKTSIYLCHDTFFKHIFNVEIHPERLESLLSALLGQSIEIIESLPLEGIQLSDQGSFVILDLRVRLSDDSIVNVEMQKCGYHFPGKRFDCYCADLIMREYNRLRALHKKNFSYHQLSPVMSIALMEISPSAFHEFPETYIHHIQMQSDTGVHIDNLAQHIYIPLDIFHTVMHNKPITTPLEAWLTALTTCDLTHIEELIEKFPIFHDIYKEIFALRTKPEELIHMYSEALAFADRNMERMMIDEWKKEADELKKETEKLRIEAQNAKTEAQNAKIEAQNAKTEAQNAKTEAQNAKTEAQNLKQDNINLQSTVSTQAAHIQELLAEIEQLKRK